MKHALLGFVCVLVLTVVFQRAEAHEVRPGYLELRQTAAETFDVMWKVPARGDLRLGLYPVLPESCEETAPRREYDVGGAIVQRWTVNCSGTLDGTTITVDGLKGTMTDVLVRIEKLDGTTQTALLKPAAPFVVVAATPNRLGVVAMYVRLGVDHILRGIDHLLFVLALVLIARRTKLLLKTVTAFTVAHSITLGLAALGVVNFRPAPVEAVIALSIVFVAAEIVHSRQGRPGITARAPWLVAFIFGLLHGFGFAGALSEIGLPAGNIPLALLCFNVGVEIGQLMFIAAVLAPWFVFRRLLARLPGWSELVPPYAIGTMAMFWVIERVSGF